MFFTVFVHLQFLCYDRMVHNYLCHQCLSPEEFKSHSWWGVLDTTLCDQVCQTVASLGTPVSSTNKTDRHNITEILLKVVLNTIALTLPSCVVSCNPFISSLHPDDHKMSCILNSSRLKNIRTGNSVWLKLHFYL